jgi:hypothetical protein
MTTARPSSSQWASNVAITRPSPVIGRLDKRRNYRPPHTLSPNGAARMIGTQSRVNWGKTDP